MIHFQKPIGFLVFSLILVLIFSSCDQTEKNQAPSDRRKSPIAIANIKHPESDTYIKIVYGQPYKRDRDVFGNIVPYGEVWRTGANEATELTTTGEILFGGKRLSSGTYSVFSIPKKNEPWKVILNNELGQWGAFEYDKSRDVMRVDAKASKQRTVTQAFTITFSEITKDSTAMIMKWDSTRITVPIEFSDN